ncbi:MAG: BlaI/MecI/CopY family transcriptional regulator [Gemmatimonadaceae bacterium]
MDDVLLGDRELDVMGVLWEVGSGTVAEVRELLPAELAYTTVLTILRNLEEKHFVSHELEGRAHRYFPRVARKEARTTLVGRLVDKLFHGSAEQLLVHLVRDRQLSADDLTRIRRALHASDSPLGKSQAEGSDE